MAQDQPLKTYGAYDKEIAIFSSVMRWKLEKNAHKGRWEDIGPERALELLDAEVQELKQAVQNRQMRGAGTPDVLLEAADVANQALILAMILINPPVPYPGVPKVAPLPDIKYRAVELYNDRTVFPDGTVGPRLSEENLGRVVRTRDGDWILIKVKEHHYEWVEFGVKTGLHPFEVGRKDV